MAITCPRCGAGFDATLFQFGHRVKCDCGAWADLRQGHLAFCPNSGKGDIPMAEVELGRISHYFSKIGVAAIEITQDSLKVGDTIHIKGHTSDLLQKIDSMQLDGRSVQEATVGQSIGIKVAQHVREHDQVFKVVE
jgi:hypothetical protein